MAVREGHSRTGVLQAWEAGSGTLERDHLLLQPGCSGWGFYPYLCSLGKDVAYRGPVSLWPESEFGDVYDQQWYYWKDSRVGGFYVRSHEYTLQQSKNAVRTGEKPTSSLSRGEGLVMPRVRLSRTDKTLASASGKEMGLGEGGRHLSSSTQEGITLPCVSWTLISQDPESISGNSHPVLLFPLIPEKFHTTLIDFPVVRSIKFSPMTWNTFYIFHLSTYISQW